jgi:beta-mannanase
MNRSIIIMLVAVLATVSLGAALAIIGTTTFASSSSVLAQTTNATTTTTVEDNATSLATRIQITKDVTNSYAISEGSVRVGSFDTIYAITGSVDDISGNSDLITSTIQSDFNSSSTVGYVMAQAANNNNTASNSTQATTTLPSPFASSKEISQRIADEIRKGIESAERSNEEYAEIRCHFGMDLPGFECRFVPLLDQVQ